MNRCIAVYMCTTSGKAQVQGERCPEDATEGHFCWTHARARELAKKKQRKPVRTILSQQVSK